MRACIGIHHTLFPVGQGRSQILKAIIKVLDESVTLLHARVLRARDDLIRNDWPNLVEDCMVAVPKDGDRVTE